MNKDAGATLTAVIGVVLVRLAAEISLCCLLLVSVRRPADQNAI